MADDARSQFIEGLRVTAEHLQHLQDRLRESVADLRCTVGCGRIGWGLVVRVDSGQVRVEPGLALASGGVRIAFSCGNPAYVVARVIAAAGRARVIAPEPLREQVEAAARRALERYR